MKKMLSVIAVAAISTSASAFDYKFNLEGRADFVNSTQKTEVNSGTTTKIKSNNFQSSLIRLNMMGAINEQLSYRMRYRFNQVPAATSRDQSTSSLDYLYVDHKNSLFTTRFGKTNWAEAYGRESFLSSTDLFLLTDGYTAYNDNIGNYRFGVSATVTALETHKLTLAISNPNKTFTDAGTEQKNNSLAYAAHYSSVMFDKMFQPTLSYTLAKQDPDAQTANTEKADFTMWAAGWRTEAMGVVLDADYKQFDKEKRTVTAVATDGKTKSAFINLAYNLGDVTPFVQYVNDKFKSDLAAVNTDYKKNSFAVGAMWKPFNDVNFRYHLLYTNINKKFDETTAGNASKVKEDRITFGIKADI